ncbi:UvrB/UvrC motif-containing protein [Bacillus sp. 31A1R]|uniref:UvrB/UvrC motif-containing protein n=1 Tax=Robertmurraya mangrovi TaxID=3098077 RepID=A0ABU5J4K7_9BACI|nr:UvrB/UvrC motif-containing protein [Bacillus sp. 31A1R]MDZ5474295.1 UvrB/UvrC motif-containing protein [Bacillus sp. 31A1R]
MICQECNERPATLHFTKINNGEKTEYHLCEKCAQEKSESFILNNTSGFSINNLLAGLLNFESTFQQPTQKSPFYQEEVLQCEGCSMTYKQFIQVGRFGCANCYETFKEQMKPILRRLHSGNETHNGKIPERIGGNIHLRKNIEDLKQALKDSIAQEEFEKAAEIRDQVRSLEKQLNESNQGGE